MKIGGFIKVFALVFLLSLNFPVYSFAQTSSPSAGTDTPLKEDYFKAMVVEVLDERSQSIAGFNSTIQTLGVEIQSGYEKGKDVAVNFSTGRSVDAEKFDVGDRIIIHKALFPGGIESYQIVDRYRIDNVLYIFLIFLSCVILISGKKGVGSIFGMGFSLAVLIGFVAPFIIKGYNPLLISILGALLIMIASIYMAHGISKQTTSAIVSTFIALVLSGLVSSLFVDVVGLTGVGSEDSYSLQFALTNIDLKGLLLGGIIIGTLGILDDVTTAQSATVFELYKTDPKLSYSSLVKKGLRVGREHVTALVNTLFLVYAGVSLGLFVIFALNPLKQPYWVLLNYQSMSEEIIRTLTGSMVLMFAVPLSTIVAAFTVQRFVKNDKKRKK